LQANLSWLKQAETNRFSIKRGLFSPANKGFFAKTLDLTRPALIITHGLKTAYLLP
jgi:hypothetical protein